MPADDKEDEVKRMHAFFFENTDELSSFPGTIGSFMPDSFNTFDDII